MTNSITNLLQPLFIASLVIGLFFTTRHEQNTTQTTRSAFIDQRANVAQGITVSAIGKNIRSIFKDKKNNYWFGTDGEGVYRYDGKKITLFTNKDGLFHNQVRAIQEDKAGNIYFSTGGGGVSRFDGRILTTLSQPETDPFGKSSNKEWKKEPDDLWFEAKEGVYRYDGHSLINLQFPKTPLEATYYAQNPGTNLSPYGVYCIFKDRKGNLWFGTEYLGVCCYDGKAFTWLTEKGLSGGAVRALFEDKSSKFWFGNSGMGLFRYDGKTVTNFTEEKGPGNIDAGKDLKDQPFSLTRPMGKKGKLPTVMAINEDINGEIWIGTYEAGVWRYDGKKLTNYTIQEGLSSYAVTAIYKDPKGALWFGTNGAGVYTFNGKAFTRFVVK